MSLNTCTISGHLGKSAELRMTGSGLAVVSFTVAVNERQRQQDGSYSDYTNWLDCTMFGKRGEGLHPYLTKGCKVSITGHLHKSSWESNGQHFSKVEIIVDEVELMGGRRETQQPEGAPTPEPVQSASIYDDDIPF